MNFLIVEDEIPSARLIIGMIESLRPNWTLVGQLQSVQESVDWLQQNSAPDLIFMDIQLSDGTCFDIFDQIDLPSKIVFTTAYDQYAIQAFEVNSIDYLLKPVKELKLVAAIEKFESLFQQQEQKLPDYGAIVAALQEKSKKYKTRFLVLHATSYQYIKTEDVAYFYTENRISYAVDFHGKEHVVDQTMERIEESLDPVQFFRTSRSHIVNIDAIYSFENFFGGKYAVKLVNPLKVTITISRLKASNFKIWLNS